MSWKAHTHTEIYKYRYQKKNEMGRFWGGPYIFKQHVYPNTTPLHKTAQLISKIVSMWRPEHGENNLITWPKSSHRCMHKSNWTSTKHGEPTKYLQRPQKSGNGIGTSLIHHDIILHEKYSQIPRRGFLIPEHRRFSSLIDVDTFRILQFSVFIPGWGYMTWPTSQLLVDFKEWLVTTVADGWVFYVCWQFPKHNTIIPFLNRQSPTNHQNDSPIHQQNPSKWWSFSVFSGIVFEARKTSGVLLQWKPTLPFPLEIPCLRSKAAPPTSRTNLLWEIGREKVLLFPLLK